MPLVPWFSAAAVAPLIAEEWAIGALETALLTVAVQLGFRPGALLLALRRGRGRRASEPPHCRRRRLVAAVANAAFALLAVDLATALPLRALSGAGIAAVYPVAMKVLAGWFRRERGLSGRILIGAITLGSATPHLLRAVEGAAGLDWRTVVVVATIPFMAAAVIAGIGIREGPLAVPASRLSLMMARRALREPSVQLAGVGYLGHMGALRPCSGGARLPCRGLASSSAVSDEFASAAAFVVAAGAVGCVVAGALADRLGRTTLTIAAMALSGSSAIVAGLLFGAPAAVILTVVVVWGITVVADSAQFSTAISELAPAGTAGSALALQTSAGFLLTGITIVGIGLVDPRRVVLGARIRDPRTRAAGRYRGHRAAARVQTRR